MITSVPSTLPPHVKILSATIPGSKTWHISTLSPTLTVSRIVSFNGNTVRIVTVVSHIPVTLSHTMIHVTSFPTTDPALYTKQTLPLINSNPNTLVPHVLILVGTNPFGTVAHTTMLSLTNVVS